MKKLMLFGLVALIFGSGCASLRAPLIGVLYMDEKAGLDASSNQAGTRIGTACANAYVGLVAMGDASIETARRNGGITMITSVDESFRSYVFGAYQEYCTIVRGR